jgi:hypothetical protein
MARPLGDLCGGRRLSNRVKIKRYFASRPARAGDARRVGPNRVTGAGCRRSTITRGESGRCGRWRPTGLDSHERLPAPIAPLRPLRVPSVRFRDLGPRAFENRGRVVGSAHRPAGGIGPQPFALLGRDCGRPGAPPQCACRAEVRGSEARAACGLHAIARALSLRRGVCRADRRRSHEWVSPAAVCDAPPRESEKRGDPRQHRSDGAHQPGRSAHPLDGRNASESC